MTNQPVAEVVGDYNVQSLRYLPAGVDLKVGDKLVTLQAYQALQEENARLLAANRDCIDHFDALMADYIASRRQCETTASLPQMVRMVGTTFGSLRW